ncbi:MAG: hypothetical protein ACRETL_09210 [Gammaproteobacteria bacterium]
MLKNIASSASYGVLAEVNAQDLPPHATQKVRVVGGSGSFFAQTAKPEVAGEYFFSPVAALVTGAGRRLLAIMERLVTDAGGSYAYCDTDSMGIIALLGSNCVQGSGLHRRENLEDFREQRAKMHEAV